MTRTFRLEMRDGTLEDLETATYPWIYREWWCIAGLDGVTTYRPKCEVRHFFELAEVAA